MTVHLRVTAKVHLMDKSAPLHPRPNKNYGELRITVTVHLIANYGDSAFNWNYGDSAFNGLTAMVDCS